jgi:hypothetical protein
MFKILPDRECIQYVVQVHGNNTIVSTLWMNRGMKVELRLQIFLKNSPLMNIIFFDDEFICSKSIETKAKIIEKKVLGT